MSNETEMKCFCLGLGLGVAAGFLFAPKSGAQTRRLIQGKAMEGTGYLKSQATNAINTAASAVERGGKTLRYQTENVAAAVQAGKAAFDEAAAATPSL